MLAIHRLFIVCVAAGFLGRPVRSVAEEPNREIDSTNIIEKIGFTGDGVGHLLLPVVISNKKYDFMLDTCSTRVVYDVSLRSMLGKWKKTEIVSTAIGSVKMDLFEPAKAFIGDICIKTDDDVTIMDLRRMRELTGCDCYGVIGLSFLKHHVVRIDFDKGEICLLKSPDSDSGQAFCLTYQNSMPCIEATVPRCERKERFIVDTGADSNFSGDVTFDFYKSLARCDLTEVLAGSHPIYTPTGETTKCTAFRLRSIFFGRFIHHNPIFSTSPRHRFNILGLGFLSRFIVTFDFPHNVMYLKKGPMFDLPDVKDLSGLSLVRHGGKTVVRSVAWFSPASWTDISPQDVLLSVGSINADQTSLYSLRRLLGIGGKQVDLVLQRGQERFTVSLMLRCDEAKASLGAEEESKEIGNRKLKAPKLKMKGENGR